jgi:hypothetical protein
MRWWRHGGTLALHLMFSGGAQRGGHRPRRRAGLPGGAACSFEGGLRRGARKRRRVPCVGGAAQADAIAITILSFGNVIYNWCAPASVLCRPRQRTAAGCRQTPAVRQGSRVAHDEGV